MKVLYLLVLITICSIGVKGQSIRQADRDSAVKYYRAFFDQSIPNAMEQYAKWRSICLSQVHTLRDSGKFWNAMIDSNKYRPQVLKHKP